ncbi:MAG: hypothetical protein KKA42_01435 [candidate division Zixibacteria bacterium]|nr:hypothetical protein [candidate division Zixibacteria bacterium]
MFRLFTGFATLLLVAATAPAQSPPPGPCESPEAAQFDFWLGTWDLAWVGGSGTNIISRELDGCVIQEDFTADGEQPFRGMSVSTYNTRTGRWHQTWVDNQGGYLDFTGGWSDTAMVLSRSATDSTGTSFLQRMVWTDITPMTLNWRWERSDDNGATWTTLWAISYERHR